MTDQEYLNLALALTHNGPWFNWKTHDDDGNKIPNDQRMTYANIIVLDDTKSKPSQADVNAKIQEIKDEQQAAIDKKASGKAKLKELGLDDAEIKALIGV